MLILILFFCNQFFRTFLCFTAYIIPNNLILGSLILRLRVIFICFLRFLYLKIIICFMNLRKAILFSCIWCIYITTWIITRQASILIWNWCENHHEIGTTSNLMDIVIFKHTRINSIRSTLIVVLPISKYIILSISPRIYFICFAYDSVTVLTISSYLWNLFLNSFRNISFFQI